MMELITENKTAVTPSGSRGIPLRCLNGFAAGSLDSARDDELLRITEKAAEALLPRRLLVSNLSFSAFAYEASPSESSVGSSIAAVVASP
jgi:hypothetical protein